MSCLNPLTLNKAIVKGTKPIDITALRAGSIANTDLATQRLGAPSRKTSEKLSGENHEVWEYGPEAKPSGFLTLDLDSKRVIGKSIWIYSSELDIETFRKKYFGDNQFESYVPCRQSRSRNENIFIDQQKGILLANSGQRDLLVSWSDAELTKLRVDQFYLKCPQLQKRRAK